MEQFFSSILGETLTLTTTLAVLGVALALGIFISLVYMYTHKHEGYAPSFAITILMLPIIITLIIALVGDNVARAFSLAGAFTIIRFRSAPGDPKDITYIFFTLAVGLACGMGYIAYACLFAVLLCLVTVVLAKIKYAVPKNEHMILKILIPEDMNYQGAFDDILEVYTSSSHLKRVKTTDFGALFELVYFIELKKDINQKEFIDKLRTRNGNLSITISFKEFEDKLYTA